MARAQNVNEFNVYNFTVECFVNTIAGDVPDRIACGRSAGCQNPFGSPSRTAMVTVMIYRSPIYVVYRSLLRSSLESDLLRTASRMVTKSDVLAREPGVGDSVPLKLLH